MLNSIGKDAVVTHQQVPDHQFNDVPDLAYGEQARGRLIVHGDSLVALKPLPPCYAG